METFTEEEKFELGAQDGTFCGRQPPIAKEGEVRAG